MVDKENEFGLCGRWDQDRATQPMDAGWLSFANIKM